jgi:hypothetical protein
VVSKIDLYNEKDTQIATGTATYLIGLLTNQLAPVPYF